MYANCCYSAAMNPEDREAYLKKKKQEAKLKLREMMKQKYADAKKVRQQNVVVPETCFQLFLCIIRVLFVQFIAVCDLYHNMCESCCHLFCNILIKQTKKTADFRTVIKLEMKTLVQE